MEHGEVGLTESDNLFRATRSHHSASFNLCFVAPPVSSLSPFQTADSVVHPDDQVLLMGNERIAVPEVLFTPLDVGLQQGGLVENIVAAVEATPTWMHGLFYENIVLVGGNTKLPNYATRVEKELRPLVPTEYKIQCRIGKESVTHAHKHMPQNA